MDYKVWNDVWGAHNMFWTCFFDYSELFSHIFMMQEQLYGDVGPILLPKYAQNSTFRVYLAILGQNSRFWAYFWCFLEVKGAIYPRISVPT